MNPTMRLTICLLLVSFLILHPSAFVRADGGTIRLSEQQGGYRITVFTTPTPVRAGPVDISVFVQDAATEEPVSEARVSIKAVRRGSPGVTLQHQATTEAATTAPAPGGGHGLVWVNTESHVYHREGSRFYGTTKKGKYMTEQDAINEGDRAAARGK